MYWLLSPPWGRWAVAALLIGFALWSQFKPTTMVEHPFATASIQPGDDLNSAVVEFRDVPAGLLAPTPSDGVATRLIAEGAPLLPGDVGNAGDVVPRDWWLLDLEVPASAVSGTRMLIVLVDSGDVVEGILARAAVVDTFGSGSGSVALPPQRAADVAVAAANGRVAVLASPG